VVRSTAVWENREVWFERPCGRNEVSVTASAKALGEGSDSHHLHHFFK